MAFDPDYREEAPTLDEVRGWKGLAVLEFGADWCPHCQGAQTHIRQALENITDLRHCKVADGKGKPLGRGFQVKLWPTLIFLNDGIEVRRAVRPTTREEVAQGVEALGR